MDNNKHNIKILKTQDVVLAHFFNKWYANKGENKQVVLEYRNDVLYNCEININRKYLDEVISNLASLNYITESNPPCYNPSEKEDGLLIVTYKYYSITKLGITFVNKTSFEQQEIQRSRYKSDQFYKWITILILILTLVSSCVDKIFYNKSANDIYNMYLEYKNDSVQLKGIKKQQNQKNEKDKKQYRY